MEAHWNKSIALMERVGRRGEGEEDVDRGWRGSRRVEGDERVKRGERKHRQRARANSRGRVGNHKSVYRDAWNEAIVNRNGLSATFGGLKKRRICTPLVFC